MQVVREPIVIPPLAIAALILREDKGMTWMKNRIIEQESELLSNMWDENWQGLKRIFPDEPPSNIYELHSDGMQDAAWQEMEYRVMENYLGQADNLRKRQREQS